MAGSLEIFSVSKYISVPIVGFIVWIMVVKGNYKIAERIFLVFSAALLMYVISALMGKPHWEEIGGAIIHPKVKMNEQSIEMIIGLIGTTIAPWMQFYMQSSVIEKGLKIKQYKFILLDIIVGCMATVVVAFFIIVCDSTLHVNNIVINEAKDAAMALKPLAGAVSSQVFAFGLFIASIFSATILPIATAFYVCEAFGFEAGIDKKWKEAPQFYWLYTGIIVLGMIIILIPNAPLIAITLWSQILNGMLLPIVLVCMILLVNNKKIMGKHVNKPIQNIIGWGSIIILVGLSITLIVMPLIK